MMMPLENARMGYHSLINDVPFAALVQACCAWSNLALNQGKRCPRCAIQCGAPMSVAGRVHQYMLASKSKMVAAGLNPIRQRSGTRIEKRADRNCIPTRLTLISVLLHDVFSCSSLDFHGMRLP
jgi:hypothetical protein